MNGGSEFIEKLSDDFVKCISNKLSQDETKELLASTVKNSIKAGTEGLEESREKISQAIEAIIKNASQKMISIISEEIGSVIKENEQTIRGKLDSVKEEL
jgi:polyhydroxyalkanoate synthesis regulator phasin